MNEFFSFKIKYILISILILLCSFTISLGLQIYNNNSVIPLLFMLAVFLTALITKGYIYGIISSLVSVLLVNFAFTFPYFKFDFTLYENVVSALIMIFVTIVTSTLITTIKKQEEHKIENEKEKIRATLLRSVSHDLRTPLTSIYAASSTIYDNFDKLSDNNKKDMLNSIKEDSKWLIHMVENLLSVTKIGNKNLDLKKTSVVLEELIDSVISKVKKQYPDKKILIDIPNEFITVSADGLLIEQVLFNLIENAIIHAKNMTKIILRVFKENNKAYFEVIDDGIGIEKEKLKNIFSGYNITENKSGDNVKKNMGIGLSVCYAIIKAHNENIYAENLKTGGMKFSFSLELLED